MHVLIVGATGATGRLVVDQVLSLGHTARVMVRSKDRIPKHWKSHDHIEVVEASILDTTESVLAEAASGCQAVASCLGHETSLRGTFTPPWNLLADSVAKLCEAIRANEPSEPVRFVLMNSAANKIKDLGERWSFADKLALTGMRLLVPTVRDIAKSADHLRLKIGLEDDTIEWALVRPYVLTEEESVSSYDLTSSPDFSFVPPSDARTRRIHVAEFMARLACEDAVWSEWKGKAPVIRN